MKNAHVLIIPLVTLARILAAFSMFIAPLPGIVLTMIFDFLDGRVFAATGVFDRLSYHRWDKALDMVGYCVELYIVWRYGVWLAFLPLFLWRAIGYVIYVASGASEIFLLCPNIYEAAVLWLFVFYPAPTPRIQVLPYQALWLGVIIILKIIQEWSLHWFVPHGGNVWWDKLVRSVLPAHFPFLKWTLSLPVS